MSHLHNQILPQGTQLGVYEIKEATKVAAFEITYRAWNHHLKEWVEIQEYFPHDFAIRANDGLSVEFGSPSDKENFDYGLKAFLDQSEILTQIEHPNIAKAQNILQLNKTVYLILDYQEGVPLSKLVQSPTSFSETELTFILISILNALQKVHEYKILHGGIQPATIILGKNGEPVLIDFATARMAIAAHTAKLADVLIKGYASPELYERVHEPGPATDFYALGATMYYCMTHNQPTPAQSRIMALSKGQPDPMASLSESPNTTFGAALLQAIEWMLQPEYNDRPQSAAEILTLLKSEPSNDYTGPITSKKEAKDIDDGSQTAKKTVWIGAVIGIIGLLIVGIWFGKKSSVMIDDKSSTLTAQPLLQSKPEKIIATSETQIDQSIALSTAKSSQESDSGKLSEHTKKEIIELETRPKQADEETSQSTSADGKQSKKGRIVENKSLPASNPVSKTELKDKFTKAQESASSQQLTVVDKLQHQSKKQKLPEKPTNEESIKKYLAAAKKAMKAVHLTTPSKDNAFKYYRMVLAIEPDNAEALAGLQKIVDRYVWFLQKARAEGKLNTAKRALQKAESVLPDDPKLKSIRAELAATKE